MSPIVFSPLTPMLMPGSCRCSGRSTRQTCTRHPPRAQWSQCHSSRKKLSLVCFSDLNVFWDFLRYYLPAFSFCRDTWPCHCCPWPPWRRPGKAQTGTFDVPATDVSTSSGPTHGKYPKNWKCDNKLFLPKPEVPGGLHRQDDRWWDHNHRGEKGGGRRWPSSARRGTRPSLPWSPPPSVRALGTFKKRRICKEKDENSWHLLSVLILDNL